MRQISFPTIRVEFDFLRDGFSSVSTVLRIAYSIRFHLLLDFPAFAFTAGALEWQGGLGFSFSV